MHSWKAQKRWESEVALKVDGWSSDIPSVQKMLNHLKRRTASESSRIKFVYELYKFTLFAEKEPEALAALSSGEASTLLQAYLDAMGSRAVSRKYVNAVVGDLVSGFFKVNGYRKDREVEVEKFHIPARYRYRGEYIPLRAEVFRMAQMCGSTLSGLRNKAIILTLYSTGLRNSTLRGLRYKDIKDELEAGNDVVMVPVYPEMKLVVPNACKGNIPYYTFLCKEAVETLLVYLAERRRVYGELDVEDPLFASEHHGVALKNRKRTVLSKTSVLRVVKDAARKAGIRQWKDVYPHCLRKSFESILRSTTVDGGRMDPKVQEFLMGHILPGSQDTYFGSGVKVNDSTISFDKVKVDLIRNEYSKLMFAENPLVNKKQVLLEMWREQAKMYGIDPMKVKIEKERALKTELSSDDEQELLKVAIKKVTMPHLNNSGKPYQSKIIREQELVTHVENGWEIIRELSNERFLVKRPNHVTIEPHD
jgi:integrase